MKIVKEFCYLGNRLNASEGCEATVTARTRLGWKKFRECGEILFGKRFSLRMKGKVYKSYVRSAMLYGSETWCLRENEVARYFEMTRKIYDEGDVRCEVDKQEEYNGVDGHVGIKGSSRQAGKGEWYEVVWSYSKTT